MALLTPFPTFARGRTQWGACYCGWWLRAVGWPGGWRQAAAGGVRSAGCWRNGDRFNAQILSRKRGNLSIADDTRTNIQQRTQHTPDAPENGSCSHLRVICDCPAIFPASSVLAGGQRRTGETAAARWNGWRCCVQPLLPTTCISTRCRESSGTWVCNLRVGGLRPAGLRSAAIRLSAAHCPALLSS